MSIILRVVRRDGERQKQEEPDWHFEPNWLLRTNSTDCHCLLQTWIVKQPIQVQASVYPGLTPKKALIHVGVEWIDAKVFIEQ